MAHKRQSVDYKRGWDGVKQRLSIKVYSNPIPIASQQKLSDCLAIEWQAVRFEMSLSRVEGDDGGEKNAINTVHLINLRGEWGQHHIIHNKRIVYEWMNYN